MSETRKFCGPIGLVASALLHLGLLSLFLLRSGSGADTMGGAAGGSEVVPVALSMFKSVTTAQATASTETQQSEIEATQEPVPETPTTPEPKTVRKTETEPEPKADAKPALSTRPATKPPEEAKPESKTAPKPTAQPQRKPEPKSKPKAKQQPKPQAKPKPKPKPKSEPKATPQPKPLVDSPQKSGSTTPARKPVKKPMEVVGTGSRDLGKQKSGDRSPDQAERSQAGAGQASGIDWQRNYLAGLQRAIAVNKFYPAVAKKKKHEGKVLVSFTIHADGTITDIRVRKSSGSALLDKAGMDALKRLGRYLPIPREFRRERWPLRVPINFALE